MNFIAEPLQCGPATMVLSECPSHHVLLRQNEPRGELLDIPVGTAAVFSDRSPLKQSDNEDGAAVIAINEDRSILLVADGVGGHLAGAEAAEIAMSSVLSEVDRLEQLNGETAIRAAVITGIERANERIIEAGLGSATTIAVVELCGRIMRPYHVGDSVILVVGQRGKLKLQTVAHSPVGYAVESGLIDEHDAMHHAERHVVSNVVGSSEMHIDVGPPIQLSPRDTVLLGSDGLFDNMHVAEIVEIIRKGPLAKAVEILVNTCHERMSDFSAARPSKPDDLTFVLFRPGPAQKDPPSA